MFFLSNPKVNTASENTFFPANVILKSSYRLQDFNSASGFTTEKTKGYCNCWDGIMETWW